MASVSLQDSLPMRVNAPTAKRARGISLLALLLILLGGIALRTGLPGSDPEAVVHHSPDELTYTRQAAAVAAQGSAAFPALIASFRAAPQNPGPYRAGYLYLLSWVMEVTGHTDVSAGLLLSKVASVFALVFFGLLAWRLLPETAALASVLLYATSALPLATARRCWQETVLECITMALLVLAAEAVLHPALRLAATVKSPAILLLFAAIAMLAAALVTVKESGVLILLCVCGFVSIVLARRARYVAAGVFAVLILISTIAALAWLAGHVGGLRSLLDLSAIGTGSQVTNQYSIAYESGTFADLVQALCLFSPAACIFLFFGAWKIGAGLRERGGDSRQIIFRLLAILPVLLAGLMLVMPNRLNLRYLAPAFGPVYLIAGLGISTVVSTIDRGLARSERRTFAAAFALVLLLSSLGDYAFFRSHVLLPDTPDLSIGYLLPRGPY